MGQMTPYRHTLDLYDLYDLHDLHLIFKFSIIIENCVNLGRKMIPDESNNRWRRIWWIKIGKKPE